MASTAPTDENDAARQRITVKEHFAACMAEYDTSILNSDLESTSPVLQERVTRLLTDIASMWMRLEAAGAVSINDELEDLSTNTVEMLLAPYVVADLHQRRTEAALLTSSNASGVAQSAGGQRPPPDTQQRSHALTVSLYYYDVFLKLMVQIGLLSEREHEIGIRFNAADRTRRIENNRKLSELQAQLRTLDDQVRYKAATSKRMAQLCAEDGDVFDERGGAEEELLRERAVLRLRWAICQSFQQVQLTGRELLMLETLSDDQRRQIVYDYQQRIEDARRAGGLGVGRDTYTILPGGVVMTGAPHLQRGAVATASRILQDQMMTAAGGPPITTTFREQVRAEVFMERNRPTMTLDEFAAMEMAEIQRQMDAQAEAQQRNAEEEAILGVEGVEERQRQYDAHWANWKDDNPPIGLSTKGNYS